MSYFKLSLNDDEMRRLDEEARELSMTRQQYCRYKIFGTRMESKYIPQEAVNIARRKHDNGELPDSFTVPDIYGEDWSLERPEAGVFGRRFYDYVTDSGEVIDIEPVEGDRRGRLAHYRFLER